MARALPHAGLSFRLFTALAAATLLVTAPPTLRAADDASRTDGRHSWIGNLPGIYRLSAKFDEWQDRLGWALGPYRVDPYINAAIKLQGMGKDEAIRTLLATKGYHSEQTKVLCRMLFVPKRHGKLRDPDLHDMHVLGLRKTTAGYRYPLAIIDGVPFCITCGATSNFPPGEAGDDYVRYCKDAGNWNSYRYRLKTADEKRAALAKLMHPANWEGALSSFESKYLQGQIE